MKRGMATALAIAGVFALSACGNPSTGDDVINEPVPGEEQPMPGDEDKNGDLDDDLEEELEDETED